MMNRLTTPPAVSAIVGPTQRIVGIIAFRFPIIVLGISLASVAAMHPHKAAQSVAEDRCWGIRSSVDFLHPLEEITYLSIPATTQFEFFRSK